VNRPRVWIAAAIAALVVLSALAGRMPIWLSGLYATMSAVSAATYWFDKRAAERGAPRVRERTLHLLDLVGGIAGGLWAQAAFHHKTHKDGFALVSWTIAALHLGVLLAVLTGYLPAAKLGALAFFLHRI